MNLKDLEKKLSEQLETMIGFMNTDPARLQMYLTGLNRDELRLWILTIHATRNPTPDLMKLQKIIEDYLHDRT